MNNVNKIHTFSDRLQELCVRKGMTVKQLTEAIRQIDGRIDEETVRSWFYRNTIPREERLKLLCNVLDCDIDYLFGRIKETTHDRAFIRHETGLSEDAIIQLQKSDDVAVGSLFKANYKPLGSAVNYMLTNEHGLALLQYIFDYINSDSLQLSYQGKAVTEDIVISNKKTESRYKLSPNEYDAVLLAQIQQELVLLKNTTDK